MSSLDDTKTADKAVETKEVEKPIEPVIPPSRIKSDKLLWAEAGEFAGMLKYCRPHNSKAERKFIAKYIVPEGVQFDKFGNAFKIIGENPIVLWSCHTDTVHSVSGFQEIVYWPSKKTGDIYYGVDQTGKVKSSCLGADDTCGVWLMLQMIRNEIPGLYIFHRGEEVGGLGSKWIAEKNPDAVKGIKYAIAFDRRGEKSVITYQRSKRCCSDEFAKSLAEQLGMGHELDSTGAFTDTASYVDLIAECTNISVGYDGAHGQLEDTNVDYLFRLRDAVLKIDVSKLVESRKPGENTYKSYSYESKGTSYKDIWAYDREHELARRQGGKHGWELRKEYKSSDFIDDYWFDEQVHLWFRRIGKARKTDLGVTKTHNGKKSVTALTKPTYQETIALVKDNAAVVADLLHDCGYDGLSLKEYLLEVGVTGNVIHL